MSIQEIIEVNKTIMEFLGAHVHVSYKTENSTEYSVQGEIVKHLRIINPTIAGIDNMALLYRIPLHIDWNLLMVVVDKIESLNDSDLHYKWPDYEDKTKMQSNFMCYEVDVHFTKCSIWCELSLDPPQRIAHQERETKKESVWYACYEFINYWNDFQKRNKDLQVGDVLIINPKVKLYDAGIQKWCMGDNKITSIEKNMVCFNDTVKFPIKKVEKYLIRK